MHTGYAMTRLAPPVVAAVPVSTHTTAALAGITYGLSPPDGRAGVSVPRAEILSGKDKRATISAARLAGGCVTSHTGHVLWVAFEQKSVT